MTRDPEDFDDAAEDRRRWEERQRPPCPHATVMVATRPWCADCGRELPPDHPLAKAALRALGKLGKRAVGRDGHTTEQ